MRVEQSILSRFEELAKAAAEVDATRQRPTDDYGGGIDVEKFVQWAVSAKSIIRRACGGDSVHFADFVARCEECKGYYLDFRQCVGVFAAAHDDYRGGHLSGIRAIVNAELCNDVLHQAGELLDADHKDPACVLARVVLERSLRQLCDNKGIPHGKLETMNTALTKAGAYNLGMQKQVTAWADRGNSAAHGQWDQYNRADVMDMIEGVRRFIAEKV